MARFRNPGPHLTRRCLKRPLGVPCPRTTPSALRSWRRGLYTASASTARTPVSVSSAFGRTTSGPCARCPRSSTSFSTARPPQQVWGCANQSSPARWAPPFFKRAKLSVRYPATWRCAIFEGAGIPAGMEEREAPDASTSGAGRWGRDG